MRDLNLTPSEPKTQVFSHFVLCFAFVEKKNNHHKMIAHGRGKKGFEVYSYAVQARVAALVLSHYARQKDEPPRSNFACLADKQACRLGFAALSAPPLTV